MILKELLAKLGLDLDAQSFAKGQLAADALKGALALVAEVAKEVGKAMIEMTIGTVKAADHIDEVAQATGLTTDELQELAYAGSFSSLSMEDMAQSMGFLSKAIVGAAGNSKELKKVFRDLKIPVRDSGGNIRSTNDILGDLADRFSKMPGGAKKTALAMQIFGRSGKQLIPFLNAGKEGIAAFREEAHKLGVVLDEETIRKSTEVDDNMNRLEQTWKGVKFAVGQELLPVLGEVVGKTLEWVKANRELIATRIKQFFEALFAAARATYTAIVFVVDGIKQFIAEFKAGEGPIFNIVSALNPFVKILHLLYANWQAVKAAALEVWRVLDKLLAPIIRLLGPTIELVRKHWDSIVTAMKYASAAVLIPLAAIVGTVVAAFVAFGVAILVVISAIADLINWFRGAESVIGSFLSKWGKRLYEGFVQPWVDAASAVKNAFGAAFDWIAAKVEWAIGKVNEGLELLNKLPGVNIGTRKLGDVIAAMPGAPGAPGMPAPATSAPALETSQGGQLQQAISVVNQLNVTQQPGEDQTAFARRVASIIEEREQRVMREAMAGAGF